MLYSFILFVFTSTVGYESFVLDYNLTIEDCTALHEQWAPTLSENATVFCELEG